MHAQPARLALLALVLVPACGGDDGDTATDTTTATSDTSGDSATTDTTDTSGTSETTGVTTLDTGDGDGDSGDGDGDGSLSQDCMDFLASQGGTRPGTADISGANAGDAAMWFTGGQDYDFTVDGTAYTITIEGSLMGDVVYDFAAHPSALCSSSDANGSADFDDGAGNRISVAHYMGTWSVTLAAVSDGTYSGEATFSH